MSNDLEESLRAALRPVDPDEAFNRKVLTAVGQESSQRPPGPLRSSRYSGRWWASAALATVLLLALVTAYEWQVRRQDRGLEARRQLIQALQVTSAKLDVAYRVVNDQDQTENGS